MLVAFLLATLPLGAVAASSPSPSPAPSPRFDLKASGSNVFIDQATGGRGIAPPEGPGFANGSPISPMSPYDWFSGAPVTPGVAGIAQYEISATYRATGVDFGATFGLGGVTGSTTNALYWGEPLIPNLNDHPTSPAAIRMRFSYRPTRAKTMRASRARVYSVHRSARPIPVGRFAAAISI